METMLVPMFMKSTGRCFPGSCRNRPGERNMKRAAAISGPPQSCMLENKEERKLMKGPILERQ